MGEGTGAGRAGAVARVVGFLLLLPVGLLYLVSGLVVPEPWLLGMWALYLVLAATAIARRNHPWQVLATPLVGFVLWIVIVSLGDVFLGWTA